MSLRIRLVRRLATTAAVAALATATVVSPAVADDEFGSGGDSGFSSGDSEFGGGDGSDEFGGRGDQRDPRRYRGVVTVDRLVLRSAPTRGSRPIRSVYRGDYVSIFCKTPGQNILGNPLWYLLTDGTWAWGSARFINNIGAAPRWC
ncbi:SH3 domain-containing protein [Streptomyces sp. GESEQ-35]|uniref:SH3 domain-containing protein n=1 Tax=Streptomyces sp. GESEQ-35 TaxID=2812657 RepID=UPI001B33D16B|nr:SH3 domain-containing protein [Streptomyces sp. GESEQ-35]